MPAERKSNAEEIAQFAQGRAKKKIPKSLRRWKDTK